MKEKEIKQYIGKITEKLDNTNEYSLWLLIQEYIEKLENTIKVFTKIENQQFNFICDKPKTSLETILKLSTNILELEEENKQLEDKLNKIQELCINPYYTDTECGKRAIMVIEQDEVIKILGGK